MRKLSLAAVLLPMTLGVAALPASALSIASVQVAVTPATSSGPCPVVFNFKGKVSLSGPGTFTYKWERSDGAIDTASHPPVAFDGKSAAFVEETWTLGAAIPAFHPFHGWVKLHILTPENTLSAPANMTLDCGAVTAGKEPHGRCEGRPDLVPLLHTPMDGWVAVKNIGTGNAGPNRMYLKCRKEGHTGPGGGCVDVPASALALPFLAGPDVLVVDVPALACGATFEAKMPWWEKLVWPKGTYHFDATVDATHLVAESNEGNNLTSSTLVR